MIRRVSWPSRFHKNLFDSHSKIPAFIRHVHVYIYTYVCVYLYTHLYLYTRLKEFSIQAIESELVHRQFT